jgi:DNA-binding winged helix-turn-helix (wHTH) protein
VGIRFGPFTLDQEARQLTGGGAEIRLSPKAFDLLAILVGERPRVLSKAVLQERLWPDTFVSEANLSNLVAELRAALDDNPRAPSFIRTAHSRGYAFCAAASVVTSTVHTGEVCALWLEWNGRRLPLNAGENIVGRDTDAGVRLDHASVSRRHARVVVVPTGAVLEDMASKNGTFVADQRVTAPVGIGDGDIVRFGSVLVTFHASAVLGSTVTEAGAAR